MEKIVLNGSNDMNCYFIIHNKKCYIVDPGFEKERVIAYVIQKDLEVLGILLTHGHHDHIGAIDFLNSPVYIHKDEYDLFVDDEKNGNARHGKTKPYDLETMEIIKIDDSTVLELDDKKIEVIHTPGHTAGGVCYKIDNDLYTGDTLFKGTVGKWIYPTGDMESLKKSVFHLLDSQDDDVNIHPGHGDSSTIGYERKFNRFVKEWKNE